MLYIVATPIGNLEDVSLRALRILKEVDLILCEDTRRTQKLLARYNITTPTVSYHQHSKFSKIDYILKLLEENKNLALVSDAGTPAISDPGNQLISLAVKQSSSLTIVPVPGPSALTAALSVCGFPTDKFIFLGFPPHKKGRKKFFQEVAGAKYAVCFYESPYRIIKTLNELRTVNQELKVVVCRELTKKFEIIYRGTAEEILNKLKKEKIKGEFAVVVSPK